MDYPVYPVILSRIPLSSRTACAMASGSTLTPSAFKTRASPRFTSLPTIRLGLMQECSLAGAETFLVNGLIADVARLISDCLNINSPGACQNLQTTAIIKSDAHCANKRHQPEKRRAAILSA
ncbi:MAG: hypothetical protein ABSH38_17110 [Verrucomicrobiota bacterium]|jgi:hypothetical protein